ncbi:MAG: SDR family NAD(P)-dependent oxidoreductase, partial [Gammaproteobacteria bacterium]|nr:SDR family NAD(P)-dependent oxidoreductase [Gammaproteobacteria bacterium]
QLDLADSDSINSAVDHILELTSGRIDVLFNNGAFGQPGAVEDLTRDLLRFQFETNLFGTQELTNRVIPIMRKQGQGRIIQNSSLLGYVALRFRGAYNASKFALEGLTDTMRLELQGSGIQVSLIEPGPISTRFRSNGFELYRKNIDKEQSHFKDLYEATERRLANQGPPTPFTLPPEAVLKKVIHAIESKRAKVRYPVTFPAYLFAWLRRILSSRRLDALLLKVE